MPLWEGPSTIVIVGTNLVEIWLVSLTKAKTDNLSLLLPLSLLLATVMAGCKSESSILPIHPAQAFNGPQQRSTINPKLNTVSLAAQPTALARIHSAAAEVRPIDLAIHATAQLQANANAVTRVSPPIAGKVTEIHACLGDTVKKGQVLACISSQEIGSLVTDLFKTETEIDSQLATDLMEIDFDLKQEDSSVALCKKQYERAKLLLDEKIGSQAALETAETEYEKHGLVIEALKQKKVKATNIANEKKRMARVSLQQKLMVLGMPPATITKIVSQRSIVNIVPIVTPQSGIVLERNVNLGELVDPSKSLFVVDDIDNLWLVADVFEHDIEKVKAGQDIEFQVDCFPKEVFKGKLDFVAGTINPDTRTLAVRAVVHNPNFKLKPKMFARMTIFCDKHAVLAVPAKSVQDAGSHKVVYIPLANGAFEERKIKVGEEAGGYVEILKGLKAGDKVVVDGSFTLRSQTLKQGR